MNRSTMSDSGPNKPLTGKPNGRLTDQVKPWLFLQVFHFYKKVPVRLRHFTELIVAGVGPDVPVTLRNGLPRIRLTKVFLSGYAITFLLSFAVFIVWTAHAGTLQGDDRGVVYFLQDIPNLLNYAFIVPLYVGLGSCLIASVLHGWETLRSSAKALGYSRPARAWSFAISAFLILAIAGFSTSNYIAEILSPSVYENRYWFVAEVTQDGNRILGAMGVYYAILNFWLLAFSLLVAAAFFSVFRISIIIGRHLVESRSALADDNRGLQRQLYDFTYVYIIAKITTVVYMVNAYTWVWERPTGSYNLIAMGVALTVIGVGLISLPRYYLELQWLKYRKQNGEPDAQYYDIRPFRFRVIAHAADTLIIGGFVFSFWWELF